MAAIWKRAYLVRRNPRLTAEEFPRRWKQHSDLGQTFPDVVARNQRVVYCLANKALGEQIGASGEYDGVGLLWLRSPEALEATNADPTAIPTMRADELKVFHQHVFNSAVLVEEHVLKLGADGKVAVLSFVRRRPGLSREAFQPAWIAALSAENAGKMSKHVKGLVIREPTVEFDGLSETWFDSTEDALATWTDRRFRDALDAGEKDLVDPAATMRFLTETCHERVA
ncbi:MAG: EthD domain-containing protein [Alphaproteobacteria bacterium]|nr:EthD domain-containing protein [Alphaproteobacteria bacterium]